MLQQNIFLNYGLNFNNTVNLANNSSTPAPAPTSAPQTAAVWGCDKTAAPAYEPPVSQGFAGFLGNFS